MTKEEEELEFAFRRLHRAQYEGRLALEAMEWERIDLLKKRIAAANEKRARR